MQQFFSVCNQAAVAVSVAVIVSVFGAVLGINRNSSSAPVNITNVIGAGAPQDVQATIYGAEWCGPCRLYLTDVERDLPPDGWILRKPTEKDAASAHVLIEHDETKFAAAKVDRIPCTIIRRNGREVKRIPGRLTPEALVNAINAERAKP